MKIKSKDPLFYRILNSILIIIPAVLLGYVLLAFIGRDGHFTEPGKILVEWKNYRNMAYLIYLGLFALIPLGYFFIKEDANQLVLKAYREWVISILVMTFSYALSGLIVDLGYLLYFIFLLIIGRG